MGPGFIMPFGTEVSCVSVFVCTGFWSRLAGVTSLITPEVWPWGSFDAAPPKEPCSMSTGRSFSLVSGSACEPVSVWWGSEKTHATRGVPVQHAAVLSSAERGTPTSKMQARSPFCAMILHVCAPLLALWTSPGCSWPHHFCVPATGQQVGVIPGDGGSAAVAVARTHQSSEGRLKKYSLATVLCYAAHGRRDIAAALYCESLWFPPHNFPYRCRGPRRVWAVCWACSALPRHALLAWQRAHLAGQMPGMGP